MPTNPLHLYRSILRAHRQLPRQIRFVGDQYVRGEFRSHRTVTDTKFLAPFFTQWTAYLSLIRDQTKGSAVEEEGVGRWDVGRHLDRDMVEQLDDDKAEQLLELHRAAHGEDLDQGASGRGAGGSSAPPPRRK